MNAKNVRISGDQVLTHFFPTFGWMTFDPTPIDDGFDGVGEPRRDAAILREVAANRDGDHDEHHLGHEPQHQDVLGDREVDA